VLPWRGVAISGWVLDPDRKKMSKSKGNVVTPMHLLEEHGADAVRYWAASGRPGTDTAFDTKQMRIGRKLAVKLLNASKFALAELPPAGQLLSHPLDRAAVARLAAVVDEATASFEAYDYARALQRTEEFFWWFCDYYLELVKGRRYDAAPEAAASVSRALRLSLSAFQRLFAPFLPFVCEEVWSWWREGSVHRAPWPDAGKLWGELGNHPGAGELGNESEMGDDGRGGSDGRAARVREDMALAVAADVLREVRKAKSQAQRPMRAPVARVIVHDTAERLSALQLGDDDLRQAGAIEGIEMVEAEELAVEVELAEEPPMEG
jgi:valyl-tRNA synthetase